MNNRLSQPAPTIPTIHVHDSDVDASVLFEGGDMLDPYSFCIGNSGLYPCSQDLQSDYFAPNSFFSSVVELEEMSELSHLNTTSQPYFTGHGYSLPHAIQPEIGTTISVDAGGLSPASFSSSLPSPTSSFASSLSPSSVSLVFSDSDSPLSPSPATPDQLFPWSTQGLNNLSSDSLLVANHSISSLNSSVHRRSRSSPSARREPVASKAMLEANSRRRRHAPQFQCPDCEQTFTALFSLKRHAQSHTGERPFACRIPGCTQRFFNSSDCKRHEKSRKRHGDLAIS